MKSMLVSLSTLTLAAHAQPLPHPDPLPTQPTQPTLSPARWSGQRFHALRALRILPDGPGRVATVGNWIDLDPFQSRSTPQPLWDSFEACPRTPDGNPVGALVDEAGWLPPYPVTAGDCDAEDLGLGYRWVFGADYNCPHIAVDLAETPPDTNISDGVFALWYNPINPAGLMTVVGTWDDMATDQNTPLPDGSQLAGFLGGWILDFGAGPAPGDAWHIFAFHVPDGMPTPPDGQGALEIFACEHAQVDDAGHLAITPLRTSAPRDPFVTSFVLWSTGENRTPQDLTRVGRSSDRQLNDNNPADGQFSSAENESFAYGLNPNPLGAMVAIFGTPGTRCHADFNGDGFLDFFDYDDYVNCFETGSCPPGTTADFNDDGFADFFDYDDFVTTFETGC